MRRKRRKYELAGRLLFARTGTVVHCGVVLGSRVSLRVLLPFDDAIVILIGKPSNLTFSCLEAWTVLELTGEKSSIGINHD